jgi:hypothetical protein
MKKSMLILLAIFVISCNKSEIIESKPIQNTLIVGNWNWIESKGGIAPLTYTPISTGKSVTLTITNNEVKEFTNGVLTNSWVYSLNTQNSIFGGQKQMLIFGNKPNQSFEIINNQLHLNDECFDCLGSSYSHL